MAAALCAAAVLAAAPRPARAHGGATIDRDPCVQKIGPWSVHFTVYEPQFDPSGEYCADVPKAGAMIVVFDLVDLEMRKVSLDLEIIRVGGAAPETIHHVAAKPYPSGVVNAEVTLPAPGRYAAVLKPDGRPPVTFPLRVEIGTPLWVWLAPLLLIAPALYYWSQRRAPSSAANGESRRNLALVK